MPEQIVTKALTGPEFDKFLDRAGLHLARTTITTWLDAGMSVGIYRHAAVRAGSTPPVTEWRLIPFQPPDPLPAPPNFVLRATYERKT